MFIDLDWPLNASSLLSASAELLVVFCQPVFQKSLQFTFIHLFCNSVDILSFCTSQLADEILPCHFLCQCNTFCCILSCFFVDIPFLLFLSDAISIFIGFYCLFIPPPPLSSLTAKKISIEIWTTKALCRAHTSARAQRSHWITITLMPGVGSHNCNTVLLDMTWNVSLNPTLH